MRKLTITLVALVSFLGFSAANADRLSRGVVTNTASSHPNFYQESKEIPDPLLHLKPIVPEATMQSAQYQVERKQRIAALVRSIKAIEDRGLHLSNRTRRKIADAALYAEEKTGVDALTMVALGRMESDFRGLIEMNVQCQAGLRHHNCYADCGITQHHVQGSRAYVLRYCKRLIKHPRLSFLKSAQEIARHVNWCLEHKGSRWHHPLRRCVLNRYNQGPNYKTTHKCRLKRWRFYTSTFSLGKSWRERTYPCKYLHRVRNESVEEWYRGKLRCKKMLRKCVSRAAYWKKLTCFEYGARKLIRAKRSCRWCYNIAKISTRYYPALHVASQVSSKSEAPSRKSDN